MNILISELKTEEIGEFADLVKEVYDEFVAADYPDEGNSTFYRFITGEAIKQRLENGNLLICARIDGRLAGVHEVRDKNHIALFFVRKQFHNRRTGHALFNYSLNYLKNKNPEIGKITVNSSPYAVEIYKRLGFTGTSGMQEKDGIKFYPMEYIIH